MKVQTIVIRIGGIVQGIGFRPFVYRLASNLTISGYYTGRKKWDETGDELRSSKVV